MTSDADLLLDVEIGDRYRLVRRLGEGGMGDVYEARTAAGEVYAVKVLRKDVIATAPTTVDRFLREARTASELTNPHIVPVVDTGIDAARGAPFLVMPLLSGFDVESLVQRVGQLDPTTAVRIAVQAARGLGAAHAANIVHRDVKPANLFLDTQPDGSVLVKLCDWGIAKSLAREGIQLTKTGTGLGTPLFLSPEQAKNAKHVDARSDVWGLGVSLYFMLAMVAPHEHAPSLAELMIWIVNKDPPHLQILAPWLDPRLAAVVHGALIRDRDARCPTIEDFANALRAFCGGSEALTAASLVGASEELKATEAPHATLAKRWEEVVKRPSALPPASSEVDALLGATLGGRYRLEELLGRGGMGAVYRATGPTGEACAIKVILTHLSNASPDARKRFLREARASASIDSEHVVRVIDADADLATGMPFIVMELLSGIDMQQLVRQKGALEPLAVTRIFLQACKGLAAAHDAKIVHRDIKPANIFLHVLPSGEVAAKICDFGIAKVGAGEALDQTSSHLTRTGGMLGSPLYMSPEQARNAKHVDARSDVWSLCMSMYEALSGNEPWPQCTTVGELILAICTEDLPRLGDIAPWLDQALTNVVERGLRRRADERWPTMSELAAALEGLAQGSDELTENMIASVTGERRSQVLPRVSSVAPTVATEAARTQAELRSTTAGTSDSIAKPKRRLGSGTAIAAAVGGALLVVSAAIVLRNKTAPAALPEPPAPAAPASSPVAAALKPQVVEPPPTPASPPVKIPIRPADATVTVNRKPAEIVEGSLLLRGEPGDQFEVTATAGSDRLDTRVTLLKGGLAEPAAIRIPKSAKASRSGAARSRPAASAAHAATPTPPATTAQPTAKAVPSAPSSPKLQEDW
jgi:serine/threonine protein kinase